MIMMTVEDLACIVFNRNTHHLLTATQAAMVDEMAVVSVVKKAAMIAQVVAMSHNHDCLDNHKPHCHRTLLRRREILQN